MLSELVHTNREGHVPGKSQPTNGRAAAAAAAVTAAWWRRGSIGSVAVAHSATAAAWWQQREDCGGGGSSSGGSATAAGNVRGDGEGDGDQRRRTRGWHNERTERGNVTTNWARVTSMIQFLSCDTNLCEIVYTNL
jgi:hypothetical protein